VLARSAPNARPPYARPFAGTLSLSSPTGGMGSEGLRLRGLKKRSAARRHVALWFPFSEHKHPSRRLRALLYGNRAERAARGAGRQESRVLTPSQTPGHLTEGKNDMSAGTLSECLSPKGRECPRVADGEASDGREPHSRAAPQGKWSLRIQADPSYLQRLRRTAPSTSPGGMRACSCGHRGEERSAHTETTVIAEYVVSFNCKAAHYTTRPDLGCSGKDLLLYAIHGTASPMMPHHVSRPTRVLSNWFEWQRARLKLKAGLPRLLLFPPSC
jgi:hypothetical protein